jgi:hypothetical protein
VFERSTERARQSVVLAQAEARPYDHGARLVERQGLQAENPRRDAVVLQKELEQDMLGPDGRVRASARMLLDFGRGEGRAVEDLPTLTTGPAWSYRVADWDGDLERLQRLGMLGWELVAIVRRCAIFKRPA